MNPFKKVLRENGLTLAMLAVTLILYLVMSNSGDGSSKPHKTAQRMSREEILIMESTFKEKILSNPAILSTVSNIFLIVLSAGIMLNVYFFMQKIKGRQIWPESQPRAPALWGVQEILCVIVFLIFLEAVIYSAQAVLFHHGSAVEQDLTIMLNSLARNMAAAAFVLWFVTKKFGQPLSALGLEVRGFFLKIRIGLIGYLAIVPGLLLILLAVILTPQFFSYEPSPQPVVEMYLKESTKDYLIFITFFVAVLGPIFEEIFFRGFLYGGLSAKIGVRAAIGVSALIFAVLHMNLAAFFPILALGVFLAVLYEKTGSLISSMTLHVTHNLIMVGLTLWFRASSL